MFKNLKQNNLSIIYFLAFAIILLIATFLLLKDYKNTEIKTFNKLQKIELEKLNKYIASLNSFNINKLKSSERIFNDITQNFEIITKTENDSFFVETIKDGLIQKTFINELLINKKPLLLNNDLPNRIRYMTNTYVSIWQKSDSGYVRTATSIPGISKKEIPVFIKNSNPIVKEIKTGRQYISRKKLKQDTQLSLYSPIYIDGKIEAILELSIFEFMSGTLQKIYKNKEIGFFLIRTSDKILVGNSKLVNSDNIDVFIDKIFSIKEKKFQFKYEGNKIYASYYPEMQLYTGFIYNDEYVLKNYYIYKKRLLISLLLFYIVLTISFIFLLKTYNKSKQQFLYKIRKVFFKNSVKEKLSSRKVLHELKNYHSTISDNLQKLSKGDTNLEINSENIEDSINESLKNIQQVIETQEREKKIQAEENTLKEKLSKGTTEITGILQHVSTLEQLSFDILKSITRFLGIQQGGIFILNEDNLETPELEMLASYAYGKNRISNKKISLNEGLVGRAFLEKESIYLTEIPEKYTMIESGFGEEEPKSLLIVPLIFNNEVKAILELASINEIEEFKINYIKEIGESIASTISNLKHSEKTEELLVQTRKQSKEIEEQRKTLEEKINTHRRQNRNLDKEILQLIEIIESVKSITYMIEYDLDGIIVDVSGRVLNLFNINKKDIISTHHKEIVETQNYEEKYKMFWEDLANNRSKSAKETFFFNGKKVKFSQEYVPIRNARRKIFRILSIGSLSD